MPLVPGRIGAVATHDDGTPELVRSRVAPVGTAFHIGEVLAISPTQPVEGQSEILRCNVGGERGDRAPGPPDFNQRNKAAWLLVQAPEVETHPPREWPENATIYGAEAAWDFYVENTNAFEAGDFDIPELIAGDDKVAMHQRPNMRGKSSGVSVVIDLWLVLTFREREGRRVANGSYPVPRPSKSPGCRSRPRR